MASEHFSDRGTDPRKPEAVLGNPKLTDAELLELAEPTRLMRRGAAIEAEVRARRDGVHTGLITWLRNYAAQHQDADSETVLRAAMRMFIGSGI